MSFADNLHDCFEMVHSHSISRRKGTSEFISFLEEKALVEENYAKGLERIVKSQYFITNQGTLSHAILALKNDSLNRAMQARILAENILKDLVEPLKELLSNQVKTLSKTHPEGKKSESKRQELVDQYEKYKSRYMRACKESESLTIQLESPQPGNRRDKIMQRLVVLKQDIEESLKGYKESLVSHNDYKEKFTDFMSKILEVYQKQEEQRLDAMKDCLRKLVVYETSYLRNLQYDIDNLSRSIESVNTKSDIKQFVDENTSANQKNSKLVFESYQGTHESFRNIGNALPAVKVPMNSMLSAIREISNKQSAEEIIKGETSLIVDKVLAGNEMSTEELNTFALSTKEVMVRKAFALSLSELKSKNLVLENEKFYRLAGMTNMVLTESELAEDIFSFKTLALALKHFQQESVSTTLQDALKNHGIWKKLEFWDQGVQMSINEDIKSHEQYMQEPENKEDRDKRLKNLVFCQLGSFSPLICSFGIDSKIVSEIILKYSCRYSLDQEDTNTLMLTVSQKTSKPEPEVQTVTRGIPVWLQELETAAASLSRRKKILEESKN